jgi:hypothetical protein
LAVPIKRPRARAVVSPPMGRIAPQVDGQVTNYFEWLGAGVYSPDYRSGSMHGGAQGVEALYYGYDERALYLRLDLGAAFLEKYRQFEIRVNVNGENRASLHATVGQGHVGLVQFWKQGEPVLVPLGTGEQLHAAFERIFELRLDYTLLRLALGEKTHLQVSLWAEGLPLQVIPPAGWLTVELSPDFVSW